MEVIDFNPENMMEAAAGFRVCNCCGRSLPLSQFYLRRRGGKPEPRCKDCQRRAVRMRRKLSPARREDDGRRTDLFGVADRARRLELILRAKQLVRDSVARHARRMSEWEFLHMD